MASKKGQTHNERDIFSWVNRQDQEFAGAIRQLGLERALIPGKNSRGVTFLYPTDEEYRQEIIDNTYSGTSTKAAVEAVESLIVPIVLHRGTDFDSEPVGSRLGVKYAVKSTARGKVELSNGVELVPAGSYSLGTNHGGSRAVWLIAKGRLPLKGESFTAPTRSKATTKGGNEYRTHGGSDITSRQIFATDTEQQFDTCMKKDRCRLRNPYLTKVTSFLNFLKAKHPAVLERVTPVLDFNFMVTFYLLFEPYKTENDDFLIPEDVLYGDNGWNEAKGDSNGVEEYKLFFSNLGSSKTESARDLQTGEPVVPYIYREPAFMTDEVDKLRTKLESLSGTLDNLAQKVHTAYAELTDDNTINGRGPMLPDDTRVAISKVKKLWQDEFRFVFGELFRRLVNEGTIYNSMEWTSLIGKVRKYPGNNYGSELQITNPEHIVAAIATKNANGLALMKFIKSRDFLYKPVSPALVGKQGGSMDCDDSKTYNRNYVALGDLEKNGGGDEGLDPQTSRTLEMYLIKYRTLPPELMALMK